MRNVVQSEVLRIEVGHPFLLSRLLIDGSSRAVPSEMRFLRRILVTRLQPGGLSHAQFAIIVEVLIDATVVVCFLLSRLVKDIGLRLSSTLASRFTLIEAFYVRSVHLYESFLFIELLFAASRRLWPLRHLINHNLVLVKLN